jgi:3-hydroxyisobutyrate dehydrogenase
MNNSNPMNNPNNPNSSNSSNSSSNDQPPTPARPSRVAVIGAGTMGTAMAARLLEAGHAVDVWSRQATTTAPLVDRGATAFADAAEAVSNADVVITMLPTAEVISAVMLEANAVEAMAPNAIWVQMATIGVEATEQMAAAVRAVRSDVIFVDAPVSGSREPAETGQLLILASGPDSVAERLAPVLDALSRKTLWLGPAGAGSKMKLVLNTWLAFQIECAAESAALAARLGVEPGSLLEALGDSPLASGFALAKLHKMLEADDRPDFALEWALKDLDLASANHRDDATPAARAIADRWRRLVADGAGHLDVSAARRGLGSSESSAARQ